MEKALPSRIRKRLLPDEETVRPNKYSGYKRFLFGAAITADDIKTALKPNKVSLSCKKCNSHNFVVIPLRQKIERMQGSYQIVHLRDAGAG